jgi:hypothetical protein
LQVINARKVQFAMWSMGAAFLVGVVLDTLFLLPCIIRFDILKRTVFFSYLVMNPYATTCIFRRKAHNAGNRF